MAKNYTIQFKSLRAGKTYVVNIGGGTGTAVPLMGGAQPFITQESDDEDMFCPIRTQSGYLRIVDNGKDANGNAFDWKDLIPATDTARPVTLTHDSGGHATVDWVGFMQAQDFGSTLYGNPQEREFPVQCVLTVTQGTDINYQQTGIQNFAYLLKQIVDAIPSAQRPTGFYIQGGADAQAWLLKKIDWQNFVSEDADGNLTARFNCYDCLQDMCAFWGWTARTKTQTMYLTMADDSAETTWLYMTYADLTTMAGGTAAGTTSDTFTTTNLDTTNSGDIFASTNNDEYIQRGHNKAVVTANSTDLDYVMEMPESFVKQLKESMPTYTETYDGNTVVYSKDLLAMNQPYATGTAISGKSSFNVMRTSEVVNSQLKQSDPFPVFRFKKTYASGTVILSLDSIYEHIYAKGYFTLLGVAYQKGAQYKSEYTDAEQRAGITHGKENVYISFGIGSSRSNATWFTGTAWSSTKSVFRVDIGGTDGTMKAFVEVGQGKRWKDIIINTPLSGKLFIDFYGSDDIPEVNGERAFELQEFMVAFTNTIPNSEWDDVSTHPRNRSTYYGGANKEFESSRQYTSSNNNSVRNERNVDAVYASDNYLNFGLGLIANPDGSLLETITYGNQQLHPEQHLANRVTGYWQTSKRRIATELRANVVPDITPCHKVVLDGMTAYPIAISRDWWNDITTLTILEL